MTCFNENKEFDDIFVNSKLNPLIYPYFCPFNSINLLLTISILGFISFFSELIKMLAEESTNLFVRFLCKLSDKLSSISLVFSFQ